MVAGERVRALAERWGVGRLLEPAAIRALLDQTAAAAVAAADGGRSNSAAIGVWVRSWRIVFPVGYRTKRAISR